MQTFILSGSTNAGYRQLSRDDLTEIEDGVLAHTDGRDLFPTTALQRRLFEKGISSGRPQWEHLLNDYVTLYVTRGIASDALALDLFVLLAQEEGRATRSRDPLAGTQQRVREGVLGFNLLATGSSWRPTVAAALPYWNRDWVAWCDKYIAAAETYRRQLERGGSHLEARWIEVASAPLTMLRTAFASASFPSPVAERRSSACYIATHIYGDYDAPQVLVLRRWRDLSLRRTVVGRAGVWAYYVVSPWLVRTLGDRPPFARVARSLLDRLVNALEARPDLDVR